MTWIRDLFGKTILTEVDLSLLTSITGEERHIEFKSTWDKKFLREIVAFANNDGGILFIGVSDKGIPIGISDCDVISTSISHEVRDFVSPSLSRFVNMVPVKLGNSQKCVIVVEVDPSQYCYGIRRRVNGNETAYSFYMRNGSSSESISPAELNTLIPSMADRRYNSKFRAEINKFLMDFLLSLKRFITIEINTQFTFEDFFLTFSDIEYYYIEKRLIPIILDRKRSDIFFIFSYARDLHDQLERAEKRILHRNLIYEEDQGLLDAKNALNEFLDSYLSSSISGGRPKDGEIFDEHLSIMPIFSPLLRKAFPINITNKSYKMLEELVKKEAMSLNETYAEAISILRNENFDSKLLEQIEVILSIHLYEYTTPFSVALFRMIHHISRASSFFH